MEAILNRRSIRRYTDQPVPEEVVKDLLVAGMSAPSAHNEQPWHFIVVTDRRPLLEIMKFHRYSRMLKKTPLAILVCCDINLDKEGYWPQDCAAATENILVAAQAMGLGGVWLGVYPDEEYVPKFREIFGIPEHVYPFSLLSIGYPAEHKTQADRFRVRRVHRDRW